jgi:hypothetical protein
MPFVDGRRQNHKMPRVHLFLGGRRHRHYGLRAKTVTVGFPPPISPGKGSYAAL